MAMARRLWMGYDMALLRSKLFAGALFAGALFGFVEETQQEATQQYAGISEEEVRARWELHDERIGKTDSSVIHTESVRKEGSGVPIKRHSTTVFTPGSTLDDLLSAQTALADVLVKTGSFQPDSRSRPTKSDVLDGRALDDEDALLLILAQL